MTNISESSGKIKMSNYGINKDPKFRQIKFDSYCCEFSKKYDDRIILTKADESYLKLICAKRDAVGKDVRTFLSDHETKLLYDYLENYCGHIYHLKFIRIFPKFDNLLWSQNVIINFPKIIIKGQLLNNTDYAAPDTYVYEDRDYCYADSTNKSLSKCIANNLVIGCGTLEIIDDMILFSEMNLLLSSLIYEKKISRLSITESSVFKNCISKKTYCAGRIKHISYDKEYNYILGAYPVLESADVKTVSLYVIPVTEIKLLYPETVSALNSRERNILLLTAEGQTLKHIACSLNISESTIKNILSTCYKKLNVKNKTQAIMKLYGIEH